MDDEDTDQWVTYGNAFSDDETEEGRLRALQFGNRRSVPAAYENRVLNEKGRPMRFHGAFTGGFSAGYFNTVGSKEGFKPKAFFSSRKARQRDTEEERASARPEDFMDEEDFGEFGIAPRRLKLAHEFDDTHIRDTLKTSIGGQSVIPGSDSFLKNFIIPSKGPLAERLLRRMGWRQLEGHWEVKETNEPTQPGDSVKEDADEAANMEDAAAAAASKHTAPVYPQLRFEAKVNTFGLGYSGLDPDLAMGRGRPQSSAVSRLDQAYTGDRHPEESTAALLQRHQTLQLQSSGFNPLSAGSRNRAGIRGQAFGVGALETDDADIYVQDRLADYDWEIGGEAGDSDAEDDGEEAELEAARLGRLSSGQRRSGAGRQADGRLDGWTAPRLSRDGAIASPRLSKTATLAGFTPSSKTERSGTLGEAVLRIPPGYMPVFNPLCLSDPSQQSLDEPVPAVAVGRDQKPRLDALSRSRILENKETESVFDLITPADQLRLKAAAAGLPVPPAPPSASTAVVPAIAAPSSSSTAAAPSVFPSLPTTGLLKPFKTDPAKQARFEAFQVLVRRGFSDEVAYVRCSGSVELNAELRDRELAAFQAILNAARLASTAPAGQQPQTSSGHRLTDRQPDGVSAEGLEDTGGGRDEATTAPLSSRLAPHKQKLVASLLASRFRSAGCMDIGREKAEAEESERRATVESLDTMEPKDHAVATETYGAMTRRRLSWHPDKLLCKRINVPDPHPESTFVGCPDERRIGNLFSRRGRRRLLNLISGRGSASNSKEFSLFDILDVNRGLQGEVDGVEEEEEGAEGSDLDQPEDPEDFAPPPPPAVDMSGLSPALSELGRTHPAAVRRPTGRGAALFACLFDAVEEPGAGTAADCPKEVAEAKPGHKHDNENTTSTMEESTSAPRVLGPVLPKRDNETVSADVANDVARPVRPPMDLFKSVFASDEELSDSSHEADDVVQPSSPMAWENQHVAVNFEHLFQSTGDEGAPLASLSRLTVPKTVDSTVRLATDQPASVPETSDLLHGPSLPPGFDADRASSSACLENRSAVDFSSTGDSGDLRWVEAHQLTSSLPVSQSRELARRHKSKRKHKRKKEEEVGAKKRRHADSRASKKGKPHRRSRGSSASHSLSDSS